MADSKKYIKYENSELGINYNKLIKPQIATGFPFSVAPYETDNDGNLTSYPLPLINATDINWGGANINDNEINTTDELLKLISTKGSGSSIDNIDDNSIIGILISAIRALQSEVGKLRNSFRFGINSYTEDAFGMSRTVDELSDIEEEEPLWATDESELSFVNGIDLTSEHADALTPTENYEIIDNKIGYTNTLTFNISNSQINLLEGVEDPKLYIYLTSTSRNITFKFINENNEEYSININDIVDVNYYPPKYNILCILSRKILIDDKTNTYGGNNFVWFSISEYGKGLDLFNGYIDIDNDNINYITSESSIYSNHIWKFDSIIFNENQDKQYIYKLDIYSKYQDFSSTIEAATPTENESYKYCAAHLTIRSMSSYNKLLLHIKELQNNELIFCESDKKLYIYSNGNLINIGSSSQSPTDPTQNTMEKYEIIKALADQGLITINLKNTSFTSVLQILNLIYLIV